MIYKHKYIVGIEDIGYNKMASNRAVLAIMEDVGCLHSAKAGYGVMDIETKKCVWVLLDWEVKILKRPIYNQEIEARTWAGKMEKLTANRYFELRDANEQLMAAGISRWLLFDLEKKHPVRLTEDIINLYEPETEKKIEGLEMQEIQDTDLEKEEYTKDYKILRRDIDINQHMHNLSYLDAAYEILPEEVYQREEFNHIRIVYKKEIKYGEKIVCSYGHVNEKHIVTLKDEKKCMQLLN